MSQLHGIVWWSELMTRDVDAAKAYYERVCGWRFDDVPMEGGVTYNVAMAHGRPVAGVMDMTGLEGMEEVPPHWFTYLAVDDLDVALDEAGAAGGRVMRPPFEVPDVGRIAIVADASGAALGLMVPATEWDPPETDTGSLENVPV
ncbi:VOC family protein [Rhodovulum sp. 12E13]|uniref:VOC family protein n=1 Tax=Rhodovulum sp. 12E13 TaxID=2203891 RepID=UPI000E190A4C|nr:VOC family protein [Rhodovulum sp. 12E13]RDC72350.1 VOC family protein [Rhodovulum sp. 12E13]